jgi:hypothetical protein
MKHIIHTLTEKLFYGRTYCGIEGGQVAIWLRGHLAIRSMVSYFIRKTERTIA